MNKLENEYFIADMTYSLRNLIKHIHEWEAMDPGDQQTKEDYLGYDPYKLCAKAMAILAEEGMGTIWPVNDFIQDVEDGLYDNVEGYGDFIDEYGNRIGEIYCDAEWLRIKKPEEALFVIWISK